MRDEAEIMDELHGLDGELKSFPLEAHWFCPKRDEDDPIDYDNPDEAEEDMSPETKRELIQDGQRRCEVAYRYSIIFGLAPEDTGRLFEDYTTRLDQLFTTCDKCVHNWHMGRKNYLKELVEHFDEDLVSELSTRLNAFDFTRIDRGLKTAQDIIAKTDPKQRSQSLLMKTDTVALLALYEALCCTEYHASDEKLSKYFNYVFEQVQIRKILKIGDVLPAMARFLFSNDPIRLKFATHAWEKTKLELSPEIFEWVIHDVLSEEITQVSQPTATRLEIQRFWQGFILMLEKMNTTLITHSLGAMEVQPNIYFLLLQHMTSDSSQIMQLLIDTLRLLLRKAPKDVWSAFGTVSAAAVAELMFKSRGYEQLLETQADSNRLGSYPNMAWIPDFIESQPPVHQHDACRTLLQFLFGNFQAARCSEKSKLACRHSGLEAIHVTLQTFLRPEYQINPSTSLIVIDDIIGLVDKHKESIIGCADIQHGGPDQSELKRMAMLVVQDTLALDCKAISAEHAALERGTQVQRALRTHSQSIWQAVLEICQPGNVELAGSILAATLPLTGLDELRPENKKNLPPLPKDHVQFNQNFQELMDNVSRVFERLSDFKSSELKQLYQHPKTSRPLFAALLSAHQATYEATVELIKAMTGESGKQDAIASLLDQALVPMLNSLTFATARITKAKNFGPTPHLIKTGGEVLKAMCDNTGVLRAHLSFSRPEQIAIMSWWNGQWRVLDMVFSTLESWAPRVQESTVFMQDFCRDGMEYAEALFDQYTIVASALTEDVPSDGDTSLAPSNAAKSSLKKVLSVVCSHVNGLTMLLRLRDTYLIGVITSLLAKLLRSLGEYELEVDDFASNYIKDACKRENEDGFKRTNLTNQQKAELQRVLYEHQGVEIIEIPRPSATIKKQATIDSWSKSADGKRHEPTLPGKSYAVASSSERNKALLAKIAAKQVQAEKSSTDFREARRKETEERKRLIAEQAAKAKALRAPAGVRGEGSGLKDIGGVAGKDHAPIRSEIMVGSSDEDSDDDEDDVDESNALVKTRKESSKKVLEYEESRRRALKQAQQGPVKKTKIQRSAKDLRARVEPNMDALYIEILKWDLFHQGDDPPSSMECRKIADSFQDLGLYKQTFAPLLIAEVWRSLVTARDEKSFKPVEITILNRLSVDKFVEVSTKMPMTASRELQFNERDIVLLSRSRDPMSKPDEPHCLARVDRTSRKRDVLEVTFRISRDSNKDLLPSLVPQGKVHAVRIADMTTTQREYAALSSLEYYDLCNEVLEAKPSPLQKYTEERTQIMASRYNLNRGQAQAILSARDNDGFTLIQGPPGSGKTKTIVAMVGTLLSPSLQQQQAELASSRPQVNGKTATGAPPKKKLLICAPSNAAVDELVVRLKEGIQPLNGPRQKINVIRLGRAEAINASVKDVMLDELVRVKLEGGHGEKNKLQNDREKLHQEAGKIKERLNELRPQMEEARGTDKARELTLQREFDILKRSQAHIGAKIDADKESGNTVSRQNEINRRRFQQEILDGAHVICGTLSGSGHDMFRNLNVEFETVIIDEAAQCIELSALIPLKYGCSKCILVGDPEQLPPTVLSRSAQSFGYEQSLFVRMQRNHPQDVHLLDTQYRMHPEISSFPSQQFYKGRLRDGDGMVTLRDKPWHASSVLAPYRFFDVEGVQTKEARGHSFINIPEINAAMKLYERLKTDYRSFDFKGMIGIIATYKAQLVELRTRFAAKYGDNIFEEIEFNTTDAFQGREREIIIFSCVRATQTGGIGFLKDIRRMNVGLTRAKSSMWVLGDSRSLKQGEFWNKLVEDAKSRDRYSGGDVLALLSKPTSRDRKPVHRLGAEGQAHFQRDNDRYPNPLASSERLLSVAQVKDEDSDVEMIDAPSIKSRKSSTSSSHSTPTVNGPGPGGNRLGIKIEGGEGSHKSNGAAFNQERLHEKRPRSPLVNEENESAKKVKAEVPPANKRVDLDAALAAQKASKAAQPSRPQGIPGVAPPRKRAPADPFIRKKPPRR